MRPYLVNSIYLVITISLNRIIYFAAKTLDLTSERPYLHLMGERYMFSCYDIASCVSNIYFYLFVRNDKYRYHQTLAFYTDMDASTYDVLDMKALDDRVLALIQNVKANVSNVF